jgi:hypothetical protein
MNDKCVDCSHEIGSFNPKEGHDYYGGMCHTKMVVVPQPHKCKKLSYKNCDCLCQCTKAAWPCTYSGCSVKAVEQYRDQYTPEENPRLCQTHDELRQFIESCVRGALKKL